MGRPNMMPPLKIWQPWRGILTLIVVVAMGIITFWLTFITPGPMGPSGPMNWIGYVSEYNMALVLHLVFLLFFLGGWIGQRFGWGLRSLVNLVVLLILMFVTFIIFRFTVGPTFPWMLFYEINTLNVFLIMALMFNNWPLHKVRQPYQGIGLLVIGFVVSSILYVVLHNYTPFYQQAAGLPPEVAAALVPAGTDIAALNPNGVMDAFVMATLNTMFILFVCIFYFLFDLWPFRLLKKQPWIGISATAAAVIISLVVWNVALIVVPQIHQVDMSLLKAAGFAPPDVPDVLPLAALPPAVQENITMLLMLGGFEGNLIWGTLVWAAIFMWWPTLLFTRGGRAPFNRQPVKGFILLAFTIITAFIAFQLLHWYGLYLAPPQAWMVPNLIPPPYLIYLWLVISWLPGLSVYTVLYAVALESWPQPLLPPPPPDVHTYLIGKQPIIMSSKEELKNRYVRMEG
ncbi:MAG: hypothetical protein QXJ86_01240 [Nitrososphaerales archaeon]